MRAQPDRKFTAVPADLLARLAVEGPSPAAPHIARQETLARLSDAPWISTRVITSSVRILEGLLVVALGIALAWYHPGFSTWDMAPFYLPLLAAAGLAVPLLAEAFGLYSLRALHQPAAHLARIASVWTLIFAGFAVTAFLAKSGEEYSRLWLSAWYLIGLAALITERAITAQVVRAWNRNGQLSRHAVLVGGGQAAADVMGAIESAGHSDIDIIGIFDDRDDVRSPPQVGRLHKLGNVAELIDFVRRARIDLLLVTLPLTAEDRLLQILKQLWVLPVDIRLSAYAQKFHYRPRAYSYIGNVPFLDVFDKPLGEWGAVLKSVEDRVIALIALILLAPVMALAALAVRLDSKGPILFKQKRYGFNNELIGVYKFRSMYHDMSDADAAKLATRDDPRITRVGRFLRKTSLDELPQLFNVLKGELSLVGPRPHALKAKAGDQLYNDVVDGYFARHKVKPGITGWAQINGWRGETDTIEKLQRRVEHDLYYVENWSLAFDLYILWRTPFALLKAENAY